MPNEQTRKWGRDYYHRHKEKVTAKRALLKDDPSYKEYHKLYYQKRKKEYIHQQSVKYHTDPIYMLTRRVRGRITDLIRKQCTVKSKSTFQLLGCTGEQLKGHIENLFQPDMNWTNYGEWHIDHIKSCASFDLSKPEEQEKCFHYTNLQPLWAHDNLSKNRY